MKPIIAAGVSAAFVWSMAAYFNEWGFVGTLSFLAAFAGFIIGLLESRIDDLSRMHDALVERLSEKNLLP